MKSWQILVAAAVIAAVAAFLMVRLAPPPGADTAGGAEKGHAAYERVLANKVIRCGYVLNAPGVIKDPNSGAMTGVVPDTLAIAAQRIGYRIEWTEEVAYSTMLEGLKTGRYDAVCASTYQNAVRAQFAESVYPLYYTTIGVYVRADDHRFDANLAAINNPRVTIATLDGEITAIVAQQDYPKAKIFALPHNTDLAQVLLNVVDRKADVTFAEPYLVGEFMRSHPGSLRDVAVARPIRTYPNVMLVAKGNYELKGLLDNMVQEVNNSGAMDRILARYDQGRGAIFATTQPYRPLSSPR
jgi:ABC-type amino acid transport substrate-binding protein